MKRYLYSTGHSIIGIFAKHRPSEKNIPSRSGTWLVNELSYEGWGMPAFPEISWTVIRKLKYIGMVKKYEQEAVKE